MTAEFFPFLGNYLKPVTESRHLVSVSTRVSRPICGSLGLEGIRSRIGLEGYRFRSHAYCLETLNTATIWRRKTSVIQRVFVCFICKFKTTKGGRKITRNSKIYTLRSGDDIFFNICKHFGTIHKFQVSSLASRSRIFWWNFGLEGLTMPLSRSLGLGSA